MIKFGRLAGTILMQWQDEYFLIGHTKFPCDFSQHRVESPDKERDEKSAVEKIKPLAGKQVSWEEGSIIFEAESFGIEESLQKLGEIFLIRRNNMVSERIWELVCNDVASASSKGLFRAMDIGNP